MWGRLTSIGSCRIKDPKWATIPARVLPKVSLSLKAQQRVGLVHSSNRQALHKHQPKGLTPQPFPSVAKEVLPVVQETGRAVSCYEEKVFKGLHSFNHATDEAPGSPGPRAKALVSERNCFWKLLSGTFSMHMVLVPEVVHEQNMLEKTVRGISALLFLTIIISMQYVPVTPSMRTMSWHSSKSSCNMGLNSFTGVGTCSSWTDVI